MTVRSRFWMGVGSLHRLQFAAEEAERRFKNWITRKLGMGNLYPRRKETVKDRSVSARLLRGVQMGFSPSGDRLHIIREMAYGKKTFLCGTHTDTSRPFTLGTIYTDDPDLCKSCRKLAEKRD